MCTVAVPDFSGHADPAILYIISQLSSVNATQLAILSRVSSLEASHITVIQKPARRSQDGKNGNWECPVCLKSFKHRDSFKGHIFRLAHPSSRPKCFLNPRNPDHVQMLADPRFLSDSFHGSALLFVSSFWQTVRSLSSSARTSLETHDMIEEWLNDGDDIDLVGVSVDGVGGGASASGSFD